MLQVSKDELVKKICEKSGVDSKLVDAKIAKKVAEMNGLVSEEGAAYIIASELGVNLLEGVGQKKLQIKDIMVGMRGVNISGRVMRIFDVKTFKKGDKEGKVGSFVIGDSTGTTRVVVWNEQTDALKDLEIGVAIRVGGGFCRASQYSGQELHLGLRSKITPLSDTDAKELPKMEDIGGGTAQGSSAAGETTTAVGTIVQAYRPAFYKACAECEKSVKEGKCADHATAEIKNQMVFSFMIDDGKSCVRCVSFRDIAEGIAGMKADEAKAIIVDKNEAALQEAVDEKLLGEKAEV